MISVQARHSRHRDILSQTVDSAGHEALACAAVGWGMGVQPAGLLPGFPRVQQMQGIGSSTSSVSQLTVSALS
ncbi:hypothetical protein V6N11_012506 [Hibiscus sabdariffa]|uniref:Uncharacterized protein n=2 Tax=Hibiscus sabdariffa TaxID=183260 RepID=A0ABR2QBC4_9ROSI